MTESKKCPQVMLVQPFLSVAFCPTAGEFVTVEPHLSEGSGSWRAFPEAEEFLLVCPTPSQGPPLCTEESEGQK